MTKPADAQDQPRPTRDPRSVPVLPLAVAMMRHSHHTLWAIPELEARTQLGTARYGDALHTHNGRDPERDLREEILDAVQYLAQAIAEGRIRGDKASRIEGLMTELVANLEPDLKEVPCITEAQTQTPCAGGETQAPCAGGPPTTERDRILAALTTDPQTAPQLARVASVDPCGICRHLWSLCAERLAAYEERRAGRASPRLFWTLGQPQPPQEPLRQEAPALTQEAPALTQEAQTPAREPSRPQILEGSASLDPRKARPARPGGHARTAAARAAAQRLAKRAVVHGLLWTYRPVAGLPGMWEIVESARRDDERLPGDDVCERRLRRWAREGFCPPRKDGLTPTSFSPVNPAKGVHPTP